MEHVRTLAIRINATAIWATVDRTAKRKSMSANHSHVKMVAHAKT